MKLHSKPFFSPFIAVFFLFVSSFMLTGCGNNSTAYDPQAEYAKACADAAMVTPEKISKNLTAITPDNKDLIWENGVVGTRVLVVSWVNQSICTAYQCPPEGCKATDTCKEGKECPYGWDTYVTVVPELKNFFQTTPITPMRIAQLLGLPPADAQKKACFLEMWISPQDLFRPSPDPEITDEEAEIDFPGSQYASPFRTYDTAEMIFADQAYDPAQCPTPQGTQCGFTDYISFFENRTKYIYTAGAPYPWTRLGYTYDWGDTSGHIGLSEFVVHGKKANGSKIAVGIKAVTPTAVYFTN